MSWMIPDSVIPFDVPPPTVGVSGFNVDITLAELLTVASGLPPVQVRPTTELLRVTDGTPRVLFTLIGTQRTGNDDGADTIITARYQLDYYGPRLSTVRTLADKVRAELDNYRLGHVLRITITGDRFAKAQADPGANNTTARVVADLTITYRE